MRRICLRTLRPGVLCAAVIVAGCGGPPPSPSQAGQPSPVAEVNCDGTVPFPPRQDLASIRTEIEHRATHELLGIGDGADQVMVALRARAECIGRAIVVAYGPRVQVTVGVLPMPLQGAPAVGCRPGAGPFAAPQGIRVRLEIPGQVAKGEWFKGTVRFTNLGPPARLETSSNFRMYLFLAEGDVPVGSAEGGSVGTDLTIELPPGKEQQVEAFGGTASCDLALGYALPLGQYRARALIDWSTAEGNFQQFWSEPAPIEVVAP